MFPIEKLLIPLKNHPFHLDAIFFRPKEDKAINCILYLLIKRNIAQNKQEQQGCNTIFSFSYNETEQKYQHWNYRRTRTRKYDIYRYKQDRNIQQFFSILLRTRNR